LLFGQKKRVQPGGEPGGDNALSFGPLPGWSDPPVTQQVNDLARRQCGNQRQGRRDRT